MISNESTPGNNEENSFYDAAPLEPHLLYQGEVLAEAPILNMPMPSRWLLLRTKSGKPLDEALQHGELGGLAKVLDSNLSKEEWNLAGDGDFAVARLSKRPVLVLSQTCDIQTKDFIQVSPIFEAKADPAHIEKLQAGNIISAFWLPERQPHLTRDCYADFELIQAIHKSYLKRILPGQHFRLSELHVRLLQRSLTRFFGRPNSFDAHSDSAPVSGVYLCIACFYLHGRVSDMVLAEGERFTICDQCAGRGWILRGR